MAVDHSRHPHHPHHQYRYHHLQHHDHCLKHQHQQNHHDDQIRLGNLTTGGIYSVRVAGASESIYNPATVYQVIMMMMVSS